jgi:hypothetical protein
MDRRIESFLGDVLALAGEEPDAVREGGAGRPRQGRGDLPATGAEKRMRDQAAHACRALCCARVAEELCAAGERASEST